MGKKDSESNDHSVVRHDDQLKVPGTSIGDTVADTFVAGVNLAAQGIVPPVGSAVGVLLGFGWQQFRGRQLNKFLESLLSDYVELSAEVGKLKVTVNDSFNATLSHILEAAMHTPQQEKLDALKNAALNAALPGAPNDDLQHIFVSWVDEFTPVHIRLLSFLTHPEKFEPDVEDWRALLGINPSEPAWQWNLIAKHVSPDRDLIEVCITDMVNRSLLTRSDIPQIDRVGLPKPTNYAWLLIDFISAPRQK